ncbi:MAG: ABC transporter substrate-binding protein [Deltaproteobacteria bacterium]|uniref:ABC transporter substrate-binding protein n=1 Tax=Desulfobacula sp. TaxID=2593537 RepID=UPI0019C091F5|nr:ABC transporter substrate-binding protein [Candidatus Desulfobacula maris]MBL6993104.1 ABC transporter substrate-binding protein [Desulfobacula sp.]
MIKKKINKKSVLLVFFCVISAFCVLFMPAAAAFGKNIHISILMASDVRVTTVDGFKNGLVEHAKEEGHTFTYTDKNAAGDRKALPGLAEEIIAAKPDIAVAAGGIEADALKDASSGTGIPVIFLSVSSSVNRGIIASMVSSGNNLTGIETNDTQLTAKRLWYISKMLPRARQVFCFHVPSIAPSVESIAIARQTAAELGFELQVAEVESEADIKKAVDSLSRATVDVILQVPAAPVDKALGSIIFPRAMAEKIPIFGYGSNSLDNGAFASYAGSRYANGQQAARLVHKIVNGILPSDIPVETPEKLELIINRSLVEKLGLKLPGRVWSMADQIVDINF